MRQLATIDGQLHIYALLRQCCQFRRWGKMRMERISALTVLRGTRAAAKHYATLQRAQAEAYGRERVLDALAPYTRSPPCTITLRPSGLSSLPISTSVAAFNAAVSAHILADLAEVCHAQRVHVPLASLGTYTVLTQDKRQLPLAPHLASTPRLVLTRSWSGLAGTLGDLPTPIRPAASVHKSLAWPGLGP